MRRLALLLVAASWVGCRVDPAPAPAPEASVAPGAAASAAHASPAARASASPAARASASPSASPTPSGSPSPGAKATPKLLCGMSPSDWCPAPAGDPCGAHKDTASCRADSRCEGLRYRGESFVPCIYDARGFATNCPTVGCVSISH